MTDHANYDWDSHTVDWPNVTVTSGGPIPRTAPLETALGLIHAELVSIADSTALSLDEKNDYIRLTAATVRRTIDSLTVEPARPAQLSPKSAIRPHYVSDIGTDKTDAVRMSTSLLLPDELAIQLGIPLRTLGQWRYTGGGPRYVKVGRHVRYRRDDVDAWLDERTSS